MADTWTDMLDAIRRRLQELLEAIEEALVPEPEPVPVPVPVRDGRRRRK